MEREYECLAVLRPGLGPEMTRLLAALGCALASPWDLEARRAATIARAAYLARRTALHETIARWENSRGALDALWLAVPAMSLEQTQRFYALVVAAGAQKDDREAFERLCRNARRLVLQFEEAAV